MRTTSAQGRAAIEQEEGYSGTWYKLGDNAGQYGQTGGFGHVRQPGDPETFTKAQADAWLANDLRRAEACVNAHAPDSIGQNQFDACVSLCFNIGVNGFATSSVVKAMKFGDWRAAADDFRLWCKSTRLTGKLDVDPILVARRERERVRFLLDVT